MKHYYTTGFTLIELLIVIVIVGVLATSLTPRLKGVQTQAKIRATNVQMRDFNTAIVMARITDFSRLQQITQNGCSDCDCRAEVDLRSLPENHNCRANRRSALQRISVAAGMDTGSLISLERDPRGSPYQLDENEGEGGLGDCRIDTFFSVGPDGSRGGTDNIFLNSAPAFCLGAY